MYFLFFGVSILVDVCLVYVVESLLLVKRWAVLKFALFIAFEKSSSVHKSMQSSAAQSSIQNEFMSISYYSNF